MVAKEVYHGTHGRTVEDAEAIYDADLRTSCGAVRRRRVGAGRDGGNAGSAKVSVDPCAPGRIESVPCLR
jgi:hypothetical protein